jgi:hypothetical protein
MNKMPPSISEAFRSPMSAGSGFATESSLLSALSAQHRHLLELQQRYLAASR